MILQDFKGFYRNLRDLNFIKDLKGSFGTFTVFQGSSRNFKGF